MSTLAIASVLFVVRLAQGLTAMGKGLLTLSPHHSDRMLLHRPALGGLLAVLIACTDMRATILDKYHYILFFLTPAINPRVCVTVTVDPDNNNAVALCPVNVRVGLAVETVGQAGRPKTITGFQTHSTPVLLGQRERAELASPEHRSIASVVEGVVIVKKVDPSLLGGLVVRIGARLFDSSLKSRLQRLQYAMKGAA